jgi:hypothetical protein
MCTRKGRSTVETPSALQSQTIYKEQFVCVADAKRRLPKSVTLEHYLKLEHISITILGGIQVSPDKPLAAMGYKRKVAIQVPYFEAAIRSVQGTDVKKSNLRISPCHRPHIPNFLCSLVGSVNFMPLFLKKGAWSFSYLGTKCMVFQQQ